MNDYINQTHDSLQTDIEDLRKRFPETRALYREVCGLLFFRYGITPTSNKLYSLVRKGSMSTPAEVLQEFWQTLREKSRVTIEHPDLPDALKMVAADMVQQVWRAALTAANTELAELRNEAHQAVEAAQAQSQQADAARERAEQALQLCQQDVTDLNKALEAEHEALQAEREAHSATTARLQEARRQIDERDRQLVEARAQFEAELAHARQQMSLAQERESENTRRLMLDFDRERTARQKSEANLEKLRAELATAQKERQADALRHAEAISSLQGERQSLAHKLEEVLSRQAALAAELDRVTMAGELAQRRAEQAEMEVSVSRRLIAELNKTTPTPPEAEQEPPVA